MRQGRRCAQLALAGLVCLGAMAQAQAPQTLVVKDGQSATEIALDEVPPGTTMDQFLLALYRLNPQAFVAGDLNRLLAQAKLLLPSAEQANQVPLALAREELAKIRGTGAAPPAPQAQAAPSASPAPAASEPPASLATAVAQAAPASSPATATAASSHWGPWPLSAVGAVGAVAALVAVGLFMRRRQPAPSAHRPAPEIESQAQGRFKPVLPGEPPAPAAKATPAASKPALFDLDLNLDGKAPPLDLPKPAGLGKLPDLNLGSPAPKAATPGPLDLSGLSLDLDSPSAPKDKP